MTISRKDILNWIAESAAAIAENESYLTELDAAIGDADHGANMTRGMNAVIAKISTASDQDIAAIFKLVGMTLISTVGGAGGPLYGTLFLEMGTTTAGKRELSLSDWTAAFQAGVEGVVKRGKAVPGDKTMIDALQPALAALQQGVANAGTISQAMQATAEVAEQGMLATIPLVARKGRASYLGERSAGHQDPGATSATLILKAAARAFANSD